MDQARCARRTARRLISLLLIVLSLTVFAVSCAPRPKFSIATGDVPALSLHPDVGATPEERVASDLAFLTSEFCNGRQVGTGGALKSAHHLSFEAEGFAALSIHSPLEAMRDHLHGPSDTVETVDASALATLAQAVADGLISGLVSGE